MYRLNIDAVIKVLSVKLNDIFSQCQLALFENAFEELIVHWGKCVVQNRSYTKINYTSHKNSYLYK